MVGSEREAVRVALLLEGAVAEGWLMSGLAAGGFSGRRVALLAVPLAVSNDGTLVRAATPCRLDPQPSTPNPSP